MKCLQKKNRLVSTEIQKDFLLPDHGACGVIDGNFSSSHYSKG
jgi:hypothetical protein